MRAATQVTSSSTRSSASGRHAKGGTTKKSELLSKGLGQYVIFKDKDVRERGGRAPGSQTQSHTYVDCVVSQAKKRVLVPEDDLEIKESGNPKKPYECRRCGYMTKSIQGCRSHYKRDHEPFRLPYSCRFCKKSHTSESTIMEHVLKSHLNDDHTVTDFHFVCQYKKNCHVDFDNAADWRAHFLRNHGFRMHDAMWANFQEVKGRTSSLSSTSSSK